MPIKISLNKKNTPEPITPNKKLLITVGTKENLVEPDSQASMNLTARRALDGSVLVTDHPIIDILIQPANMKVVSFVKESFSDEAYFAQNRLFDFLKKKGVIKFDSIKGGNVHGSLEAEFPEVEDRSALEAVLLTVGKWVNEEKAAELEIKSYEREVEDMFLDPSEEDSTELGEIPHPDPKSPERFYHSKRPAHGNVYGYFTPTK